LIFHPKEIPYLGVLFDYKLLFVYKMEKVKDLFVKIHGEKMAKLYLKKAWNCLIIIQKSLFVNKKSQI